MCKSTIPCTEGFPFPSWAFTQGTCKGNIIILQFSTYWIRAAAADSKIKPNGLLAKHARWKVPLVTWTSYSNPGSEQTRRLYLWVTEDTLAGEALLYRSCSLHTSPSFSLSFSSSVVSGMGYGQRAPSHILISSRNWVSGSETGIRVAVPCRQFQRLHLPPLQPSPCRPTCNGVLREAAADFTW